MTAADEIKEVWNEQVIPAIRRVNNEEVEERIVDAIQSLQTALVNHIMEPEIKDARQREQEAMEHAWILMMENHELHARLQQGPMRGVLDHITASHAASDSKIDQLLSNLNAAHHQLNATHNQLVANHHADNARHEERLAHRKAVRDELESQGKAARDNLEKLMNRPIKIVRDKNGRMMGLE
jgi:regulator of replication initiation timing